MVNPLARVSEEDKLNLKLTRLTELTHEEIKQIMILGIEAKIGRLASISTEGEALQLLVKEVQRYNDILEEIKQM